MFHFKEKFFTALVLVSLLHHKKNGKSGLAKQDYTCCIIFHSKTLATVLLASST